MENMLLHVIVDAVKTTLFLHDGLRKYKINHNVHIIGVEYISPYLIGNVPVLKV